MKNTFFALLLCFALAVSCAKVEAPDPFLIKKSSVGLVTDSTKISALKTLFANDSVVHYTAGDEFSGTINSIEIFDKGGKKLLNLSPAEALDSTSVVSSVRIIDERYKTEKNISVLSSFKDIKNAYTISRVDNLINAVLVSVNEINATFTIDKKELPGSLRFNMDAKIDPMQIPESATIKFFMIHF